MLQSYKSYLKELAETSGADFSKRITLRLQFRAPATETPSYVRSLRNLILVMPDLISQIQAWAKDDRIPRAEKSLVGYLLTYLHHPLDVIPFHRAGLFGHLEEAYLTGRIFSRICQFITDPASVTNRPGSLTLMKDVPAWLDMAKKVIPSEAQRMDRMIGELIQNRFETFEQVLSESAGSAIRAIPASAIHTEIPDERSLIRSAAS